MSDLNIGIVGMGWVAGAHIETFKNVEGANVTAVCSRRELDEAELEAQFGIPVKVYNDYAAMVADVDVVDVCTPHPLHPEQSIVAAEAGKHVLIEKPIAIDWESAKMIRDAVHKANVKSCVCFEVRFCGQFVMTKSVIDQGLLGDIHYGEIDYYHGIGPWYGQYEWNIKKDMGGSSLLTAGCHALDALIMCMGDEVEEVTSYDTTSSSDLFTPYEYATTSVTILKFKKGGVGKCASVVDCLQPYYFHTHLVGSHGSMLDNKFYSSKIGGITKDKWSMLDAPLIDSGDVNDHPYQPQFQEFVNSIHNDTTMPLTDFDTAFESHRVAFAADRSAAEGRPVNISEMT